MDSEYLLYVPNNVTKIRKMVMIIAQIQPVYNKIVEPYPVVNLTRFGIAAKVSEPAGD